MQQRGPRRRRGSRDDNDERSSSRAQRRSTRAADLREKQQQEFVFDFLYNRPVWAVAAPALAALAVLEGGRPFVLAGSLGLIATYCLDLLGSRDGALCGVWLTAAAALVALAVAGEAPDGGGGGGGWVVGLLRLGTHGLFLALLACWATLQFRWVTSSAPETAVLMERALLVLLPLPAAVILTSGFLRLTTGGGGGGGGGGRLGAAAALALALRWGAGGWLAPAPRPASLRPVAAAAAAAAAAGDRDGAAAAAGPPPPPPRLQVHGSREAAALALAPLLAPALLQLALFRSEIFGSDTLSPEEFELGYGMSGLRLAIAIPFLMSYTPVSQGAFWWAGGGLPAPALGRAWRAGAALAAGALAYDLLRAAAAGALAPYLAEADADAAFHRLARAAAALALAPAARPLLALAPPPLRPPGAAGALAAAGLAAGAAHGAAGLLGPPLWARAAAAGAGAGAALALEGGGVFSDLARLLNSAVGSLCAALFGYWFCHDAAGFLKFRFAVGLTSGGFATISAIFAAMGLLVPGAALLGGGGGGGPGPGPTGALFALYLAGVAALEVCLVDGAGSLYAPLEAYPAAALLGTAALGGAAARALRRQGRIGPTAGWFAGCLCAGKALALPAAFGPSAALAARLHAGGRAVGGGGAGIAWLEALVPALGLCLAFTAPYVLEDMDALSPASDSEANGNARSKEGAAAAAAAAMGTPQLAAHGLVAGVGLAQAALPVVRPLLALALGRVVTSATLAATLLGAWGLHLLSLVATYRPEATRGRRLAAFLLLMAALSYTIQPELDPWVLMESFQRSLSDAEHRRAWAPLCLLVGGGAAGALALRGGGGANGGGGGGAGRRWAAAALLGGPLGAYLALAASEAPQYMMIGVYSIMVISLVYIFLTSLASSSNPQVMEELGSSLIGFFGSLSFGLLDQIYLCWHYDSQHEHAQSMLHEQELQALVAASAAGAAVAALSLLGGGGGGGGGRRGGGGGGRRRPGGGAAAAAMGGGAGAWAAPIANACALYAFAAAAAHAYGTYGIGKGDTMVLFLCSVLMLSQKDSGLFSQLSPESSTLAAPTTAAVLVLAGSALYSIFARGYGGDGVTAAAAGGVAAQAAEMMRGVHWKAYSVWTAPSLKPPLMHLLFLPMLAPPLKCTLRYLWTQQTSSTFTLASVAPLGLMALFIAQLTSLKILGFLASLGCLYEFITASQLHVQSSRMI